MRACVALLTLPRPSLAVLVVYTGKALAPCGPEARAGRPGSAGPGAAGTGQVRGDDVRGGLIIVLGGEAEKRCRPYTLPICREVAAAAVWLPSSQPVSTSVCGHRMPEGLASELSIGSSQATHFSPTPLAERSPVRASLGAPASPEHVRIMEDVTNKHEPLSSPGRSFSSGARGSSSTLSYGFAGSPSVVEASEKPSLGSIRTYAKGSMDSPLSTDGAKKELASPDFTSSMRNFSPNSASWLSVGQVSLYWYKPQP